MVCTKELFAKNLRRYMKDHGLNQKTFAGKIFVSTATVSDWLNGIKAPSFDSLDKIAAFFCVPVADLFVDFASPIHPEDKVLEDELLFFIRNKKDAEWIVKQMMVLSNDDLSAYRGILRQVQKIKENNTDTKGGYMKEV